MSELRAIFGDLGYTAVSTLLRSGNVVFRADRDDAGAVAARVEAELESRLGMRSSVLVLSRADLAAIVADNPLLDIATDPARLLVTVLATPPDVASLTAPDPSELAPEVLEIRERAVYQWCPDGISKSTVPSAFWRQFGTGATARNWRTLTRLLEMLPHA